MFMHVYICMYICMCIYIYVKRSHAPVSGKAVKRQQKAPGTGKQPAEKKVGSRQLGSG